MGAKMRYATWLVALALICGIPGNGGAQSARATPLGDFTVTTTATWIGSGTTGSGNAFRNEISCTNHSATIAVRWGDSTVTTTKGQRVAAGATVRIENKGAIYMIAESSTATVSCTEEIR